MSSNKKYLAFDLGASNGRCVMGSFDGQALSLQVIHRFENGYIRVGDHLYWNMLGLWANIKASLAKAAVEHRAEIVSVGVDTWGVDFALLDRQGDLVSNPYSYRDPYTTGMLEEAFKIVPKEEIFQTTGIQFLRINSIFQLLAIKRSGSPALEIANTFLMIPDLINYWLTGSKVCEYTIASISQTLSAATRDWAYPLLEKFGIPTHIFPEILDSGQQIAPLLRYNVDETGLEPIPVIAVGAHDTASAVAAVPAEVANFAYISSGTWAPLGAELSEPLLGEQALAYNFSNEGGVYNTIRLLRNIVNMWLIQECVRIWSLKGESHTWEQVIEMADGAEPFLAFIDPDDPGFALPENMPAEIRSYCSRTEQRIPQTKGEIMRVCLESLAMKYRYNLEMLGALLNEPPEVFHIVGGASRNNLLNQLTANALDLPVVAGPAEATALGNLIVQMIAAGDLIDLSEGRQLIRSSFPVETFEPADVQLWNERYAQYLVRTGLTPIIES
jgi:rhamnulokinase